MVLAAFAISLSACGGGGTSSPAPYKYPWAVSVHVDNATGACATVAFFQKTNGSQWYGPSGPDGGPHVKPGQTGATEFTFFGSAANAQFRVQAGFYKTKKCSGPETIVQADSETISQDATVTATLRGTARNYSITMATGTMTFSFLESTTKS